MPVIDANGKLVGTVKHIHAPTQAAQSADARTDLADATPQTLLRMTGAGLMDNDSYIQADQIASSDEDRVVLSVTAKDLRTEDGRWI
jgi:hypothetical protein